MRKNKSKTKQDKTSITQHATNGGAHHDSNGIPSTADPDFEPYPASKPLSGPGSSLSGQQRELLRRLLLRCRIQSSVPLDEISGSLPKGVRLNEEQHNLFLKLAPEVRSGKEDGLNSMTRLDYWIAPPSIDGFINDPYFLGASQLATDEQEWLWPWWKTWLIEQANLESFLHNLVISGGIGVGKTTIMVTLLLYRICLCACLRDPYSFYGLNSGTPIHFVILSVSRETLLETAWQRVLTLIKGSPFFLELCGGDLTKVVAGMRISLKSVPRTSKAVQMIISGGSQWQHQIGRNILAVGFDEANYRLEKDGAEAAHELFGDLRARIVSRFRKIGAFNPGLTIVASSAADQSCFTEELMAQIEEDGDPNGQQIVAPALYDIKPGLTPSPWSFKVAYGLPNVQPLILSGCYMRSGLEVPPPPGWPATIAGPHEPVPKGARSELVPADYYDEFVRSPRKALQKLSGISLGGSNRLFPSLVDMNRCLRLSADEGVPMPTRAAIIPVSDEDDREISHSVDLGTFVRRIASRNCPLRHPNRLRYAHMDLATTGLAGVAICHIADQIHEETAAEASNAPTRLIIEYDFILTLSAGRTRPICYEKIFNFLWWLHESCGFQFGLVTADSYQSQYLLQRLQAKNIKTDHQSVDRDKRAYLAWQAGFQEGCIRLYAQSQLFHEAAYLIELDNKIDHLPNRTKDTTDAAAGAYLNAISSDESKRLGVPTTPPVMLGISPHANASPSDPFGFYTRITVPKPLVFEV
jgi:hypothetical protein